MNDFVMSVGDILAVPDPIDRAVLVATVVHMGQRDQQGEPYILHPLRVMATVRAQGGTQEEIIAAVLHDTVEDTRDAEERFQVTGARLTLLFPEYPGVADKVLALSRNPGEVYLDYVRRAVRGGAGKIKRADIEDNLGRLPPAHTLRHRYQMALQIIERPDRIPTMEGGEP